MNHSAMACLLLFFSMAFRPASSQNYSTLWLTNSNTTGAVQTPLSLGTTPPGTTQPSFNVLVTQTSPFPDYVFDPGYPLPGLDSVSDYLKAYRHLPDVPTAENVKKDGLDLGTNEVVMLKKIEELTLYVIEQDKESRALREKVKLLEAYNQAMEKRLQILEHPGGAGHSPDHGE